MKCCKMYVEAKRTTFIFRYRGKSNTIVIFVNEFQFTR